MIYIALLRGINVGGKNIIKMAELRRVFEEELGLVRVQTYIQSGNVLFKSSGEEESALRKRIEQGIESAFGISVSVILRTAAELRDIAVGCPFTAEELAKAAESSTRESLYVSILREELPAEEVDKLQATDFGEDQYVIQGKEIYLLYGNSTRNSKLSGRLDKLGVPATVRNFKTLNKLIHLANEMEQHYQSIELNLPAQ
ncbi:DUF1697 domain-containing protein [Paenibacillus bouchesdurhonensis]|uniref:DUF1697 domain-containing protein n=1 Tax=Paenibacillus bouchesdurhonensis TaxID=1870990 RepID=UPI000DA62A2F|nr:DUF1697 domain-containing protein [Paenibacillus bouchesdurhonensis]